MRGMLVGWFCEFADSAYFTHKKTGIRVLVKQAYFHVNISDKLTNNNVFFVQLRAQNEIHDYHYFRQPSWVSLIAQGWKFYTHLES